MKKLKTKTVSSEEMVRMIVHEGSPGVEVKLWWEGFVKWVGVKTNMNIYSVYFITAIKQSCSEVMLVKSDSQQDYLI